MGASEVCETREKDFIFAVRTPLDVLRKCTGICVFYAFHKEMYYRYWGEAEEWPSAAAAAAGGASSLADCLRRRAFF